MAAFTVIDHTEIGSGGAAYWEETSISSSYDHLLIKASLRGEYATRKYVSMSLTVNSVTSSVYSNTSLYASSTSLTATREAARGDLVNVQWPADQALADTFGCMDIWIPNYSDTSTFKPFVMRFVSPNNSTSSGDWATGVTAGLYAQASAISSIKIASGYADDLAQYSAITLYGVTGA